MRKTLLCSHNPLFIKSLYGLFIEGGFSLEIVDHIGLVIKRVMEGDIELLVMDASTFGLSVDEAVEIIRNMVPELPYIIVGPLNSSMLTKELQHGTLLSMEELDLERLRILLRVLKEPEISIYKGGKNEA